MIQKKVSDSDMPNPSTIASVRECLLHLADASEDTAAVELRRFTANLIDLTTIAESMGPADAENDFTRQIVEYCDEMTTTVEQSLMTYPDSIPQIENLQMELESRWGEYLDLLPECDRYGGGDAESWVIQTSQSWEAPEATEEAEPSFEDSKTVDISALMSSLGKIEEKTEPTATATIPTKPATPSTPLPNLHQQRKKTPLATVEDQIDDPELIPAFVDDAQQCLAGMEMCLLELDRDATNVESMRQFCRELHTLKGASGTVGLSKLAEYLHDVENQVQTMSTGGAKISTDSLLECVDSVRMQLQKLQGSKSKQPQGRSVDNAISSIPAGGENTKDAYVRIESSKLDRLMDLLAELVMLRNRRETYVSSLKNLHHEVNSCATRLRLVDTHNAAVKIRNYQEHIDDDAEFNISPIARDRQLSSTLTEISKDVGELARSLQQVFDPLSHDNSTVSHLIGCFRTELMELRRQPIAGLFRRLYRVARDASHVEERSVELHLQGQGTRAERALQERLYEPLMHIIRNSVSHGIESEAERLEKGKPATGQITLNAHSDTTTLYIEIRDDGRGLDEQRLEKRGRDLGLIPPGTTLSKKQLWELILQPGFSTKTEVSQISGRGVGMDVVASQIRALRGRLKLDSVSGQYTSIQLEIPLRSTIEHAMIVRCGEQLFALPMHSVYGTQTEEERTDQDSVIGLHQVLGLDVTPSPTPKVISLRNRPADGNGTVLQSSANKTLTVAVDDVVGVEEVVVRSLPSLLNNHDCISGLTLSGQSETVQLLDVPRLCEVAMNGEFKAQSLPSQSRPTGRGSSVKRSNRTRVNQSSGRFQSPRILIVDDSLSVRTSMSRKLQRFGYETIEASDGVQAMELLRHGEYAAITSDVDMPRMNGIDFITEVRRGEKCPDIPVVFVTGRRDDITVNSLEKLKPLRVITKPISDSVVKSIVQLLQRSVAKA